MSTPMFSRSGSVLLCLALALASSAVAGPNAGGVVVLHRNPAVVYSVGLGFCGQAALDSCSNAVKRADTNETIVLHALAAFPFESSPRMAGLCFGVEYDDLLVGIAEGIGCGDFQLSTSGWPGSYEGTCITWFQAHTGHLKEVCWFSAYSLSGGPAEISLGPHPTGGGNFADDAVPAHIDPIAGYGSFGFYQDGFAPCPPPPITIELVPSNLTVYQPCAGSFDVDLRINDARELAAFELCLGYDPALLEVEAVIIDETFLESTGRTVLPLNPVPCSPTCMPAGTRFGAVTTGPQPTPTGSGRLATIRFAPQGGGAAADSVCLADWEFTTNHIPPHLLPILGATGLSLSHRPFCFGDFNGDGDVTVFDLSQIIPKWRCCAGDGCYNSTYDVNLLEQGAFCASTSDGCIDVIDIQTVAGRWHLGCPGDSPRTQPSAGDRADLLALVRSGPSVRTSPAHSTEAALVGDTTSVAVVVDNVSELGGFEAQLSFDPTVLQVDRVVIGALPGSSGRTVYALSPKIDNLAGTVRFGACSVGLAAGQAGSGVLARVVFQVESCDGSTDLDLSDVLITGVDGWPFELESVSGGSREIPCASDVADGSGDARLALFRPRPNPSATTTEFSFSLPASSG
ncbi:MAG: hypothetical protein IT349_07025, partial [Candidatus Eisenbacteria bacterium]|nr:hypothetical protein [Candidatus Eisenbacteria bacterium]